MSLKIKYLSMLDLSYLNVSNELFKDKSKSKKKIFLKKNKKTNKFYNTVY